MKYTDDYTDDYRDDNTDDYSNDYTDYYTNMIFAHLVRIGEHLLNVHFAHLRVTLDNFHPLFLLFILRGCGQDCEITRNHVKRCGG